MTIQILLFLLSTFFICAVLGAALPFKIMRQNYYSLATEGIIIVVMDLFLVVSDPSLTGKVQKYIGITIVLIVSTYLAIFLISQIYLSISLSAKKIKSHYT